jgi:hypothetical protein
MRRRRQHALFAVTLLVFAGVTCTDSVTAPSESGLVGRVGVAPALSAAAVEVHRDLVVFGLSLDNLRLKLTRTGGEIVTDTVVAIGDEQDEVQIELSIRLSATEELLQAFVELRDGEIVLFSGSREILVRAGQSRQQPPALELEYVGPGATAAFLSVSPAVSSIFTTDSVDFTVTALDANQQSVPATAVAWSVKDAARGVVSAAGRFKPTLTRGETYVIAKLPTGLKDSARVSIVPLPTQIVVVSGDAQNGRVGSALAEPIVVEVRAADNLPVPGVQVGFAVATGGGSLGVLNGTTDASGRVSTTLTLGTVAGPNAITVTAGLVPALAVNATGKAEKATKLSILRQPSTSAVPGVPLAVQPKVKMLDIYGNVVGVAGVQVNAAATASTGPQLGGGVTATTDANGVAAFTGLVFASPTGTTALVFSQDTLASVTSTSITVGLGAPAALVFNGNTPLNLVAGSALTDAPTLIVKDAAGNNVPGVSVRLTMTGGVETLYDETRVTDDGGSVSLGVIPVPTVAGSYQITAASGSLAGSPIQLPLSVVHADAAKLAFITQPTGTAGIAGGLLSPIVVELRDQFGNRVTTGSTSQGAITLSLAGGTTGAVLGPSPSALTQAAQIGRATFNVSVDQPGTGYALTASAGAAITSIASAPFDITSSGSARLLVVSGGEQGVLPQITLADSIVVRALDGSGDPMVGIPVTFSIDSGGGTLNNLGSPVQVTTDASGLAAVAWRVGTGQQLMTASMSGGSEKIRAYVADRLVIVTEPSTNPQSGVTLVPQPKVRFTDAFGRLIRASQQLIEAELVSDQGVPSGTVQFSTASTDADGLATFTQLVISGPITEQIALRFFHRNAGVENPDIAAAASAPITLRPGLAMVIEVADATDRRRVAPGNRIPLQFSVTDGINPVPGESVNVSLVQGTASCVAPTLVTSNTSGIATVELTAGAAFTSCRALVQLQRSAPNGQPLAWQSVYAVDPTVALWVGGTAKDLDPSGWTVKENWFDGSEPLGQTVFIPGAVDFSPRTDASLSLPSMYIESFGSLDLKGNGLTVSGSLLGGGFISNTGVVTLTATKDEKVNVQVDGAVRIGEKDKTTCAQGQFAYTAEVYLIAGSLELNCGFVVDGSSAVNILGDLLVQSTGGSLQQNSGVTSVGRDAVFLSGMSNIIGQSFSVAGRLTIGPNARFDQQKGTISIDGDASFEGSSTFSEGMLFVKGNLSHTGNGDNQRFFAENPHVTHLAADKEDRTITWNVPLSSRTSRIGRLVVQDRTPSGYRFTNADERLATILDVHDLYVAPDAQLSVPEFFTLNAGGIPGLGVRVDERGKLTNAGNIIVINAESLCSPLNKGPIQPGFSCMSK